MCLAHDFAPIGKEGLRYRTGSEPAARYYAPLMLEINEPHGGGFLLSQHLREKRTATCTTNGQGGVKEVSISASSTGLDPGCRSGAEWSGRCGLGRGASGPRRACRGARHRRRTRRVRHKEEHAGSVDFLADPPGADGWVDVDAGASGPLRRPGTGSPGTPGGIRRPGGLHR